MTLYLKSFNQFVRVLLFYCVIAAACALLAICSTYYAFSNEYHLGAYSGYGLHMLVSLFNRVGRYFAPVTGMVAGLGLPGKHELAMLMSAGTAFLVFLVTRYRSNWMRLLFGLMLILFASISQQTFSKTSIAGSLLIMGVTITMVAPWRKWLVMALLVALMINVVGMTGAYLLQPEHQRKQQSVSAEWVRTSSNSKFKESTFAQRRYIWGRASSRIGWSRVVGNGPDSLGRDGVYGSNHGHNIFITLAAEYGVPATLLFIAALLLIFSLSYTKVFVSPRAQDPVWFLQLILIVTALLALFQYQFDLYAFTPHLWLMIGLLLAALRNLPDTPAVGLQAGGAQ